MVPSGSQDKGSGRKLEHRKFHLSMRSNLFIEETPEVPLNSVSVHSMLNTKQKLYLSVQMENSLRGSLKGYL